MHRNVQNFEKRSIKLKIAKFSASLWFTGRILFYSIGSFAIAQSPLSNLQLSTMCAMFDF